MKLNKSLPIRTINITLTQEAYTALMNYKIINNLHSQDHALNQILVSLPSLPTKLIPKYKRPAYKQQSSLKPIRSPNLKDNELTYKTLPAIKEVVKINDNNENNTQEPITDKNKKEDNIEIEVDFL